MFFSGEPGASIPGVRDKIEELYGARVIDCGSMAEMTPWMNVAGTAETPGMLCWQDVVYTEVCDPTTMRRVPYGERGTPVYTHLERTSQPMIRLVSGDLSLVDRRAESVRPHLSAAAAGHFRAHRRHVHDPRRKRLSERDRRGAERDCPHYGGEHRIVISREAAMDELAAAGRSRCGDLSAGRRCDRRVPRATSERKLQKLLGLRTLVEVVGPGSIAAHRLQGAPRDRRPRGLRDMQARSKGRGPEPQDALPRSRRPAFRRGEPAGRRAPDLARRSRVPGSARGARRNLQARRPRACHRHYRRSRARQVDPRRQADGTTARQGRQGRHRRGRPVEPLFRRRDPRRSHPHVARWHSIPASSSARMATRGATGGLARATLDAVDILDVAGFDTVIIETVGVGQDEVEIVRASHTTIVVSAPGLGDEIQAIKAGILEIADIHVVSKCDRSDSNRTITDLKQMLMLGAGDASAGWTTPVIGTSAIPGPGFEELMAAIERHRASLSTTRTGRRPPAAHRRVPAAQDRREAAARTLREDFAATDALARRAAHATRRAIPIRWPAELCMQRPAGIPGSAP